MVLTSSPPPPPSPHSSSAFYVHRRIAVLAALAPATFCRLQSSGPSPFFAAEAFAPPSCSSSYSRRSSRLTNPPHSGLLARRNFCDPPSSRPGSSSTTTRHSSSLALAGPRAALKEKDAEQEESATDDDDDDARDLEDARGASAVLNWARRTLGWFGAAASDDESSSSSESSSSTEGGFSTFSFPWFTILDPSSDEYKRQSAARELRIDSSRDLTGDGFGPLLPVAEKVDQLTGGWGLSYADLTPETPKTPLGVAFLATNAFYALAGLALTFRGELVLGTMTEIAGIVSFWYHYSQLEFGQNRSEVRLALLTDYMTAGTALITGGLYMVNLGVQAIPLQVLLVGGLSVACLTASWVWEFGYAYLFWHSLWHIFSAYAGYLVGRAHLGEEAGGGVEWILTTASSASGIGMEGGALGVVDLHVTLSSMLATAPHSLGDADVALQRTISCLPQLPPPP